MKIRSDRKFEYELYDNGDGTWNVPCPDCGKDRIKNNINNVRRALTLKSKCGSCRQIKPLSEHVNVKSLNPAWARTIKENYNNECAICFSSKNLEAHHILPRRTWSELSLNLNNGICLCSKCHKEFHSLNGKKQIN